ncbi:MAG: hypothetical protein HOD68_01050 [Flavobacteriales bacterium]|nr:hypothetical protein [Flavobacteriales bacterium]
MALIYSVGLSILSSISIILFPSIAWLICSLMSLEVVLIEPLGLPIGFPLVPFLNGILYRLVYNRKYTFLF